MRLDTLIDRLLDFKQGMYGDVIVQIYDPVTDNNEPITGFLF